MGGALGQLVQKPSSYAPLMGLLLPYRAIIAYPPIGGNVASGKRSEAELRTWRLPPLVAFRSTPYSSLGVDYPGWLSITWLWWWLVIGRRKSRSTCSMLLNQVAHCIERIAMQAME